MKFVIQMKERGADWKHAMGPFATLKEVEYAVTLLRSQLGAGSDVDVRILTIGLDLDRTLD